MQGEETVAVIDFGSQYTQLIARRIRELRVYCEIVPCQRAGDIVPEMDRLAGIVLSGGPNSVYAEGAPVLDERVLRCEVPILGICYGLQILALAHGGRVERGAGGEYGRATIELSQEGRDSLLLEGVPLCSTVWMSHGDRVETAPSGFVVMGSSEGCPVTATGDPGRGLYGLQFHPEVTHTAFGNRILENFLTRICGCQQDWQMTSYIDRAVQAIRARTAGERVIVGLSGGVDSSVAALLCHRAVGNRLRAIFVDNGLLRKGEAGEVEQTFRGRYGLDLQVADARDDFLEALAGVADPEEKRRRIGKTFIDIFARVARQLGEVRFLAQGTLYPDVIESVSAHGGPTATIKTHHNVGGLPDDLQFELIEPLRDLFKDEVREVGRLLGLDEAIVMRHPFPGPGLAVRVLGEVSAPQLDLLREADAIFMQELRENDLYGATAQAFCVLLPVRSVGVMGDARTYEQVVALRAVRTCDFMTADWAELPHEFLGRVAGRIINEVKGINRVVYDISSKPPATIEWE